MRLIDADELMERVRSTITEQSGAMDWINLIASMPEVDEAAGWIPVMEQLPETEMFVLISLEDHAIPMIGRYVVNNSGFGTFMIDNRDVTDFDNDFYMTAWMPLPEPYRE